MPSSRRHRCVTIDADLSMRSHVQRTVASCFAVLRQLRSIRRSVPSVYETLVVTLVLTRLDYGNATLAGIPAINRLPSPLGSYHGHSCQFPLATPIRANSVQAGGHCLPSSSRHCSSISVRPTVSRC